MLRFLSLFVGPIFAKEMTEIARRKRYYVNRVLYGLVLLLALFLIFSSMQWRSYNTPPIRMMAEIAEGLFLAVSSVQYWVAFLLAPLFLCGVVASEREERTLELLFTTRLTDAEIILGKFCSRLAVLMLLTLCGLPVLSLIMFFGGIDPQALWRLAAATFLAAFYSGAHAIFFSTTTKSTLGALVRTYWWMALWLLGLPLILTLCCVVGTRSRPVADVVESILLFINPIGAYVVALDPNAFGRVASTVGPWFFPFTFVIPLAWSVFLIVQAIRLVRDDPSPRRWPAINWSVPPETPAARSRWEEEQEAHRRASAESTLLGQRVHNPLWLRSRLVRVYDRANVVGRIQWAAWLLAGLFCFLILVIGPQAFTAPGFGITFLIPAWIAVATLAALLSATSLAGDRRRGFLDLVLLTPLTPAEVVDGTLLSIWEHLKRLYWLPWALGLLFSLTTSISFLGFLCSLVTATLFGAVLIVYGIACSLTARTASSALLPTFVLPLLMLMGIPILEALFGKASGPLLWLLSACLLIGGRQWVRSIATPATVGCFFIAVHLCLTALATAWTVGSGLQALNPGSLTITPLEPSLWHWSHPSGGPLPVLMCYWIALTVNFVWARTWLIRHFDRLVERTRTRPSVVEQPPRVP
jgi:ABC-type transport system involved in multi-copper enzyme maturation permease subunit